MGSEPIDATPDITPETAHILAEAQRRLQEQPSPPDLPPGQRALVEKLNRGVFWLAHHWLACFNMLAGLYVGGALLAPILMHFGASNLGLLLYTFYRPFCHQYPFRSWFLFGPTFARPLTAPLPIVEMHASARWLGSPEAGYKMALCQRDIAIYGMIFLSGVLYGGLRRRRTVPPLPLWLYFVFGILPMLLDGGVQWLSYLITLLWPGIHLPPFETIPLLRALTGALFGAGIVGMAYPILEDYFKDVRALLQRKFGWL